MYFYKDVEYYVVMFIPDGVGIEDVSMLTLQIF